MAITATAVGRANTVWGNKRVKVWDLVFSGNYATGGESYTAADAKLKKIEQVIPHGGVAVASDLATAIGIFYNHATSKFTFYESGAANAALAEKTNSEAYPTGCKVRVTVVGY